MPTYRSILKKSISITIRNKKLWLLGFFAALFGNGGEYEILITNIKKLADLDGLPRITNINIVFNQFLESVKNLIASQNPITNFLLLVSFAWIIYLVIISQATIILSVYKAVKKKHKIAIKKNWLLCRKKFWELFFTTIFLKGIGIILGLVISWPFVILITGITGISIIYSIIIISAVIFAPLYMVVSFLLKYTIIYIITKNKDPLSAIQHSIKLFLDNWLITIENAVLLLILNLLWGMATLLTAIVIAFAPIVIVAIYVYPLAAPSGLFLSFIAWIAIILGPILGSILAVFQLSVWTTLFVKLNARKKMHSKIARTASAILEKAFL